MNVDPALIRGWEVVTKDGHSAVIKDRAAAERYAVTSHGTIHPLGRLDGTEPPREFIRCVAPSS